MSDLLMVVLALALFGVCVGYVSWCDRIIGPDPVADTDGSVG
jgi:hypothetical protein